MPRFAYTGTKTWENGTQETYDCDDWHELCLWFAASPEAGIVAYDNLQNDYVDQATLQRDVSFLSD